MIPSLFRSISYLASSSRISLYMFSGRDLDLYLLQLDNVYACIKVSDRCVRASRVVSVAARSLTVKVRTKKIDCYIVRSTLSSALIPFSFLNYSTSILSGSTLSNLLEQRCLLNSFLSEIQI
jgi:hypothetical protein